MALERKRPSHVDESDENGLVIEPLDGGDGSLDGFVVRITEPLDTEDAAAGGGTIGQTAADGQEPTSPDRDPDRAAAASTSDAEVAAREVDPDEGRTRT